MRRALGTKRAEIIPTFSCAGRRACPGRSSGSSIWRSDKAERTDSLPDGGDSARVSDLPVCSDQLQSFHDGSRSDDAISWILRVGFWKRQCAHADASSNRETTNRRSTCKRKSSTPIKNPICFLRNKPDSSYNVKSEMARPRSACRCSSMEAWAVLERRGSPLASQTTACVSRRINTDHPIPPE